MTVYLDLVFFINVFFDFILLYGTKYILKEHPKFYRIVLGSLIGGGSIFFLFLNINSLELFILKIIISIMMIVTTFGKNNFFKTYLYFYIISIFLGGCMYFLNYTFSSKHQGLIFFSNGLSINFIVMLILSPVIVYLYIKEYKNYKIDVNNYHDVTIYISKNKYNLKGYLDTGNTRTDPYKKRGIILINLDEYKISIKNKKVIYVPYKTINATGVIPCYKIDKVLVDNKEFKNLLIGNTKKNIKIGTANCILPNIIKEDL